MAEIGDNFARLTAFIQDLQGPAQQRIVRAIGQEALHQSKECFRLSRNPYGEAWAPLKRRKGKPLLLTGRGRNSLALSFTANGIRLGTNVGYMRFHQDGVDATFTRKASSRFAPVSSSGRFLSKRAAGKKHQREGLYNATRFRRLDYKERQLRLLIPQRAFFPIAGRGIGPIWESAFLKAAAIAFRK